MKLIARVISVMTVAALAVGCAATPPAREQAQTLPQARTVDAATVTAAGLSGEQIVALQHVGYKMVNEKGETYYCSTEPKTGSRLQKDNVCLTEKELVALREETRRNLQNVTTQIPPPQGK